MQKGGFLQQKVRAASQSLLSINLLAFVGMVAVIWWFDKPLQALAGLSVLLLLVSWNIIRGVARVLDPIRSPIVKGLAKFGDIDELETHIVSELQAPPTKRGALKTTPSWLIHESMFHTSIIRFDAIAWAYHRATTVGNGLYSYFDYSEVVIWTIQGDEFAFELPSEEVLILLVAISQRTPWANSGYSMELSRRWNRDRPAILDELQQRRKSAKSVPAGLDLKGGQLCRQQYMWQWIIGRAFS